MQDSTRKGNEQVLQCFAASVTAFETKPPSLAISGPVAPFHKSSLFPDCITFVKRLDAKILTNEIGKK